VATVESCTGGGVAFAITEVAGSSQWFEKSWVTYSNQAKHEEVGVSLDTLTKFGAVSSEVVCEMAEGGLRKSQADYCVAVSGIAGPGGGSAQKPVGLVWFAVASKHDTKSFSRCFNGDRQEVREQAISVSLQELIDSSLSA
jgi:nicotinamide-nucleotide amidase